MSLARAWVLTTVLLAASVLILGLVPLDRMFSDPLYHAGRWVLDRDAQPYRWLLYDGLKRGLIVAGAGLLLALIASWRIRRLAPYRRGLLIVVLAAITVPVVTGALKRATNIPCPKHLIIYGGDRPHTAVWESYAPPYDTMERIRCYPAGHASGGFALMALCFMARTRRRRIAWLLTGVVLGWLMGGYKMLIGDHFFSHTWVTMVLAWWLILLIAMMVYGKETPVCPAPSHKEP